MPETSETPVTRVALVTGGSRGIGRAISLASGPEGLAVAVNYAHRSDAADEVVDLIRSTGGQAMAVAGDVSQSEVVTRHVRQGLRGFGAGRGAREQRWHHPRWAAAADGRERLERGPGRQSEFCVPVHQGGHAVDGQGPVG